MQRLTPRLSATSRASCTRSVACASPSGCTMNSRWPRGGSPRRASTLVMPASQITASCSSSSLREAPTQVRWAIASISVSRLMRVTISSVRPREDPPAPQVTLTKEGPRGRSSSSVSKSAATPASFFGGKNSKEKTGSPRSAAKRSMSVILIYPDSPRRTPLRREIASGPSGSSAAAQHQVADAVDLSPLVEGVVPGEDGLDRMDLVRGGDGRANLLAAPVTLALVALGGVGERSLVHEHPDVPVRRDPAKVFLEPRLLDVGDPAQVGRSPGPHLEGVEHHHVDGPVIQGRIGGSVAPLEEPRVRSARIRDLVVADGGNDRSMREQVPLLLEPDAPERVLARARHHVPRVQRTLRA